MKYVVTDAFTQISETTGTIQNASRSNLVEISNSSVKGSGILLEPYEKFTYSNTTLYARCVEGGGAEIRVVPFFFDLGGTSTATDSLDAAVDEIISDAMNGNYTSAPDTDATINEMLNNTDPIDTGDGFSDYINDLFP